jgi:pyruvate formate lyase activating enzyme
MPTEGLIDGGDIPPEDIVKGAVRSGCTSIAYTYTEPTIFMELCAETARAARARGLANVFVSNGYMTREAIDFAKDWLDAINIDLKAFTEGFYTDLCRGHLEPVLDTIRYIARHTDIWMELTTLIIPGRNDSDDELKRIAEFIANEASVDVPWHVSRFYPQYKLTNAESTGAAVLERAYAIGKEAGLRYIYIGNMPGIGAESTYCYSCGQLLIERVGYRIIKKNLKGVQCPQCKTKIAGVGLDLSLT